jgi:formylglycine-generating enzyme required for sulfatase activity
VSTPKRIDPLVADGGGSVKSSSSHVPNNAELSAYLVGLIDVLARQLSKSQHEWWIDRSMIPLDPKHPEIPADDQDKPGSPVSELLSQKPGSITFLVGESGSGKSSTTHHLGRQLAGQTHRGHDTTTVPVFANAADLLEAHDSGASALDALVAVLATFVAAESVTETVIRSLLADRELDLIVFIDGLDAAYLSGAETATLRQLLASLEAALPDARFIAPCRQEVWSDVDFGLRTVGGAFLLRLLGTRDIAEIVTKWWNVKGDHGLAPQAIIKMVTSDGYLNNLCRSPLMLGYMLTIIERSWRLPESVGGVCHEISAICMSTENGVLVDGLPSGGSVVELEQILSRLAWTVARAGSSGEVRVIEYQQALEVVRTVILETSSSPQRVHGGDVNQYADLFKRGIEIFGEKLPGSFGFRHDALELYFAGRHLSTLLLESDQAMHDHLASPLAGPALRVWAEASAHAGSVDPVLVLVEDLFETGGTNAALVGAEILAAAAPVVNAARSRWAKRWTPRVQREMHKLRSDRTLSLLERMRAGDVLGRLGDDLVPEEPDATSFCAVESGRVRVYRELPASTIDRKFQRRHWSDATEVDLSTYEVARFPVTNAEYQWFVDAGGYRADRYWESEDASRWLSQDEEFLETLVKVVAASFDVHYSKDVELQDGGGMPVLDHTNLLDEFSASLLRRDLPLYWLDGRYNGANQPVVGVNWWEANAYCCWLTDQLRSSGRISSDQVVRLLREQEWEHCAAGGQYWTYPWGEDWVDDAAHVRRSHDWITRAVPIGCFPWSSSPLGPECMVGNVWEWCLSEAPLPPTEPFDGIDGVGPDRTTRGSSWLAKEPLTRNSSFRSWDPPCNAYVDLSFRVAIASIELS